MSKLDELIDKFRNDESWNTLERNGSHRFDEKLIWLEQTIKDYAKHFEMSEDEVVEIMEKGRNYSWPNYYQPANFPSIDEFKDLVGVFKTIDDFVEHSRKYWKGFKCPKCKNIGANPQECQHRIDNDGVCDWTSYGLFSGPDKVIVLESGFKVISIFEPVPIEESEQIKEQKDE